MAVVYAQTPHVRVTGPETFAPGWWDARVPVVLEPLGVNANGVMLEQASAAFPWEPMSSSFYGSVTPGPFANIVVAITSEDPILPFINYDVRAHWPPFGPESAFGRWAARVGINPVQAAHSYASHDHPGSFAMERIQQEAGEAFVADLIGAVSELLNT